MQKDAEIKGQTRWWSAEELARKRPFLEARRAALKAVRAHFQVEGFAEVETPALQVSSGIERHIRSMTVDLAEPFGGSAKMALHTSPEFAMKKLLVGGMTKIAQICRVYRNGERGPLHHPEFTMVEWYRTGTDYNAMMNDCVAIAGKVAKAAQRAMEHDGLLHHGDTVCDPDRPAERLTVSDVFARHAKIDLLSTIDDHAASTPNADKLRRAAEGIGVSCQSQDTWEDLFFRIMLDRIEPQLGRERLTLLCDYPACLAALARRKPTDPRVAERFELYACGVELANGFSELTDAVEQRRRFEHDRELHRVLYGTAPVLDEDFFAALDSGLPDSSGCALGFDRLVMLAAHAREVADVLIAPVATAPQS